MLKRILTYSILGLVALGGFFGNTHIENQGNRNISSYTISFEQNITYASTYAEHQGVDNSSTSGVASSSESVKLYNDMIDKINIVLAVLSALISPIILFVGWLMSPDWTSGDIFGLRPNMVKLWITVTNIVYIVYAILLILIALGTMFNQDKFSYKVMLPKLALGMIMVPFTWMFVQATISIATLLTASVMTIPSDTIKTNDSIWFTTPSIPEVMTFGTAGSNTDISKIDCKTITCISPKDFIKNSGGMYGPLIVYGYSIFKFQKINHLESGLDYAKAALQIVHTSIVSAIMFAVFGLLVLALTVILLVRAIKLWIYAIFSPLFTFRFVAGSNIMGGSEDTFTVKEFVGLAFLPAIIGLTLSFGLIMINAVQGSGSASPDTSNTTTCSLLPGEGKPCKISNIMGSANNSITRTIQNYNTPDAYTNTEFIFGGLKINFTGKAANQANTESTSSGTIDAVGGMFGTLIIDVIALVFIWVAFMAAKNVSKAVSAVAQPFEDMGKKVGNLAMSIPKYAPILPASMGGSLHGLNKGVGELAHLPEAAANKRYEASDVGQWIKSHNDGPSAQEMENLRGAILSHPENMRSTLQGASLEKLKQMYSKIEENKGKFDNDHYLDSIGVKDSEQKKIIKKIIKDGPKNDEDYARLYAILAYDQKHDISEESAKAIIKAGKTSGTNAGTNTGTTSAATTGNGVIALGGININYTGVKLDKPDEIVTQITDSIKAVASTMNKPTLDELKKELAVMGIRPGQVEETANKINTAVKDLTYKPKP